MLVKNEICPQHVIAAQVANSFMEDMSIFPDWTANLIPSDKISTAIVTTNVDMVLCGVEWADSAFKLYDSSVEIKWHSQDGAKLKAGAELCKIHGYARSQLSAERTALNFLQLLSGTATSVAKYVDAIRDTKVMVMDTRKTIPGLRLAQKYAVHVGGGFNQRAGLYDGVLIKENHIVAHGGIKNVLAAAFANTPPHIPIQIEVETFAELIEAIESGSKLILLDNMDLDTIKQCVEYTENLDTNGIHGDRVQLEVSGNVNLTNIREYALTGVDRVSIGGITKNVQAIDLSMRFMDN
jgi:nicotinate-nucleotide pyrophosphorylase (carboxylating)